eukprot:CAMPEP_0201565916 /NCGR_PEP_ID=MMETSP0190_2-20130828/5343_1 /ASSEMBLY_ACC=CAM_ASM_000263 /TAXON_ID=37353 /ORGANISM="Rosalina sp." /LENGTH=567 /DNA_ID=CAMNT_0047983969 /DNA_START=310 /DNA_END=2013 /DNA_ORIENTATION=+
MKSFKEKQGGNKFVEEMESKEASEVPPLEKLTVDLTTEDSSDTNEESAASLTLSHKENKLPNDDEDEDEDSDADTSSDEESSDEDDELYAGMDKDQIAKIKAAMGGIQDNFEEQQKIERKERIEEVKNTVAFNLSIDVSDEQALFIDEFVTENHYNLEEQLQDEGVNFLASMKEMMEQKALLNAQQNNDDNDDNHNYDYSNNHENDYDFGSDDDEDWVANEKKKKANRAKKRKGVAKNTNLDGTKRCGRLLLNDALKNPQDQTGWSDARKKAWKNRKTSQNAYFYRFNVPGQPQKNGKWTKAEHELFMKRVLASGANDKWGIFSKAIPGRVGYQCSNYWRGLVKEGDVTDPNYYYDGKKLHFKRNTKQFAIREEYRKFAITINRDISGVWKPLPKKHPLHPSDEYCLEVTQALAGQHNGKSITKKKNNRKKRKRNSDDSDDEYEGPAQKKRKRKRRNDDDDDCYYGGKVDAPKEDDDNPLPDFQDIITGSVIVKPAISPHGHVLGYDTWTKILRTTKQKNTCPFTLQHMTRRSLVKLTKDNIDQYKEIMVNITDDQLKLMSDVSNQE